MPLFALGSGGAKPSLFCYDHIGRGMGASSTWQKLVFIATLVFQPVAAAYISFFGGAELLLTFVGVEATAPPIYQRAVFVGLLTIIELRYVYHFYYIGSKLFFGLDTIFLTAQFHLFVHGVASILAFMFPLPLWGLVASAALGLSGWALEWIADEQLKAFVATKEAGGTGDARVMTTGLWAYSRHPNFVGNSMYWISFGGFSGMPYMALGLFLMFTAFYHLQAIPAHEAYMAPRYGAEWKRYTSRVPIFWPCIPVGMSAADAAMV